MFWKFNLLNSKIDTLLEQENVTLQDLLDEDDILQECKANNRKLIDFLILPENLEELVNLVIQEPAEDMDEKLKYKHPNTACELLTSDVSDIYEKLCEDVGLMGKVYGFLEAEGPLNPLLASFFSKVMGLLINRKSEVVVQYIQGKDDFVGLMLRHMGTSAIKDLVLRLISCINSPDIREMCVNWLNEQKLVQKLVAMIHPSETDDKHSNASQALCDIIRLSRQRMTQMPDSSDSDPLLDTIQSQDTLSSLLDNMFNGEKVESVIVCGLAVIQTLLEFRRHGEGPDCMSEQLSATDAERLTAGVANALQAITPRLKDFHALLLDPPKQHYFCMATTVGTLDPPLGNSRLQIARLIATLLMNNNQDVDNELTTLGTLNILLDLYFQYIWNNFLHTQVEQCLGLVLRCGRPDPKPESDAELDSALDRTPPYSPSDVKVSDPSEPEPSEVSESDGTQPESSSTHLESPLLPQLMEEGRLLRRVMDAWEDNDVHQSRPGGHRRGYMGHLTKIANHLKDSLENGPRIKELYQELSEETRSKWDSFTSSSLAEVNKQNLVEAVGSHALQSSSEDDDPEFSNIPFPQDSSLQQAFHNYQLQPMTSPFIDQFGYNEEEFAEQEERVEAPFTDRISSINFDITSAEDNAQAATLFEQACNERMQQYDDADSDEDLWEEKEITFPSPTQKRTSIPERRPEVTGSDDSEGSTDSDEELDSPAVIRQTPPAPRTTENMDIDNASEDWTANFEAMDTAGSPDNWANFDNLEASASQPAADKSKASDGEGWADFSSFNDIGLKSMNNTDPGPQQRSSSPVAMDTADSNSNPSSRTAAYLVSSAPADLATETSTDSTDVWPATATATDSNTDSSVDAALSSSSTDTSSPADDNSNPTTTTDMVATSTPDSEASEPSEPHSSSTLPAPCAPSAASQNQFDDGFDDDDDGDLSDNFNFLSSVGLMKSSEDKEAGDSEEAGAAASQPNTNSTEHTEDLEEARAKAKKALEEFDLRAKPSAQNGPL